MTTSPLIEIPSGKELRRMREELGLSQVELGSLRFIPICACFPYDSL
jgi:hypothetical protein